MKLPVYDVAERGEPVFYLDGHSHRVLDADGNAIALTADSHVPEVLYADVPAELFLSYPPLNPDVVLCVHPRHHQARAAFLAGEGTLTVEEVRVWAGELGEPYELDGCKDPTPKLMVAVVPNAEGDGYRQGRVV